MDKTKKSNVYCLELEDGYYYIGRSYDIESRFISHIEGEGSTWTKLHKPIKIVQTLENVNGFEEDRMVKQYMSIHGIDKVRGGAYSREKLSQDEKAFIQREIWSAEDKCMRCGRNNHTSKFCKALTDVNGQLIFDVSLECGICGRQGHRDAQCYAKTYNIEEKEDQSVS